MDLREEHHTGAVADYAGKVAEVQFILSYLLRPRTLKDPGQPASAEGAGALPPAGRPAGFPGGPPGGAHQQLGGADAAAGSDCPPRLCRGIPLFPDLVRGRCLCRLRQRHPDPPEEGLPILRGGSSGRPLPCPKKREFSRLTSQNPGAIQSRRITCTWSILSILSSGSPAGILPSGYRNWRRRGLNYWPLGGSISNRCVYLGCPQPGPHPPIVIPHGQVTTG
jgi:hypothetical protein